MNPNNVDPKLEQFIDSEAGPAPRRLLLKVQDRITSEMPSIFSVMGLMMLIHIVASALSLAACPQFGIRLFFQGAGLDHLFMHVGHEACFFLCGFFYLGSSFVLARLVFPVDAWIVLKKSRFSAITGLGLLSMGTLSMVGHALSFELSVIWFLGAYLGAWLPLRGSLLQRTVHL